jgi:hypothetical protein
MNSFEIELLFHSFEDVDEELRLIGLLFHSFDDLDEELRW